MPEEVASKEFIEVPVGRYEELIKKLESLLKWDSRKPSFEAHSETYPNTKFRTGWFTSVIGYVDLLLKSELEFSDRTKELFANFKREYLSEEFSRRFKTRGDVALAEVMLRRIIREATQNLST